MEIERIYYPVKTLGFGDRVGIWTIGCPHLCFNCSNPELWQRDPSKDMPLEVLFRLLCSISSPINGLTISGGEPFVQYEDLFALVAFVHKKLTDDVLVYSGYTLKELQEMQNEYVNGILENIAVLIDGRYMEPFNDNISLRGSSNQKIHILNEKYKTRYKQLMGQRRQMQTVFYQNHMLTVGIPMKNFNPDFDRSLDKIGVSYG